MVQQIYKALLDFIKQIEVYKTKLQNINSSSEINEAIATDFLELSLLFIKKGDGVANISSKPEDTYLINYCASEIFKNLLILHRDIYLELAKVSILLEENQINNISVERHFLTTIELLIKAINEFISTIYSEKDTISKDKKVARKLTLYKNPWELYKSQFQILIQQIKQIETTKNRLFTIIETFSKLKEFTYEIDKSYIVLVNKITENTAYLLNKTNDTKNSSELLPFIDDQLIKNKNQEISSLSFSEIVNKHIDQLSKFEVIMGSHGGLITTKFVDFKKQTQKWFDYEILPKLMDLIGLKTNLTQKYSNILINLKNSIQLSKKETSAANFENIIHALNNLQEDIKHIKSKEKLITDAIYNKVNNQLLISNLLRGKEFLEVPLNSSLTAGGSTLLKKIKGSIVKSGLRVRKKYKKSINYESLSNLELSTQCIVHRQFTDENNSYDSLFLNKNFLGDLFLVSRKKQESKIEQTINEWHNGFNKSVLVIGERLSGRSTFLDYTSKKYFGKDVVILTPNSNAIIDGRKFKTTTDLEEALFYVKHNNIKSTKPAILIDDLELWRDQNTSLLFNVRALINFIETEADKTFVIVSTTTMMSHNLNNRVNFTNAFSNTIDVSEADKNEITEAILLRHGAAHKDLINEKLELISTHQLKPMAYKTCKQNLDNFGNTLQAWTYNTFVQGNDKVLFKDSYNEFLDFFTPQEVIILKQTLFYKTISEFGLKRVTTLSFESDFKTAIRRLINVKVLERDVQGNLHINTIVVNDVARIINTKIN